MQYIYTEEDIKAILDKYGLYGKRVSPNMYIVGLNQNYLFGNISISSNMLVCEIHFNAGDRRYSRKYTFNDAKFELDIAMAAKGMLEKENYRVNKTLDNFLK